MNTTKTYTVRIDTYMTLPVSENLNDYEIYELALEKFLRTVKLPAGLTLVAPQRDAEIFDIRNIVHCDDAI